jgi:hypothetical protein
MSTNEKWHRLGPLWRDGEASGPAVVAFAVALAVAWSTALILRLTPGPEPAQPTGAPDVEVSWPVY